MRGLVVGPQMNEIDHKSAALANSTASPFDTCPCPRPRGLCILCAARRFKPSPWCAPENGARTNPESR